MKYNRGKIKQEHHILSEFLGILKNIEKLDEVKRIIPGRISRSQKGSSHFLFSVSYPTRSGLKCIMKKGGTAQELFLIGEDDKIIEGLKLVIDKQMLKGIG